MTEPIVQLTIDERPVQVPAGTTLLEAARKVGISIPVLCYSPYTTAHSVCRLCVVEVEGMRTLQPACLTAVQEGLVVHTRSPRVIRARRILLEMLAASVDLSASPDLQKLMAEYEVRPDRFTGGVRREGPFIDDNPVFIRDYSRCVLCWRCVQVCGDDVQYNHAIHLGGRGFHTRIVTFFDRPLPDTPCVFCGNCVGTCPTGALQAKREYLLERGTPPETVLEITRFQGRGKRSRGGPHLDRSEVPRKEGAIFEGEDDASG